MKKFFLLISVLVLTLAVNAAIPELTKSSPLTLTAASEGFLQSNNAKALEGGEWINWSGSTIHEGFAKWRVHISDPGIYAVTLDMKSTNTYEFRVRVQDPLTSNILAEIVTEHADRHDYANTELPCLENLNIVSLEPGEYDIVVSNIVQWSAGMVRGLTFTYLNGARINLPATLAPSDALLSERAFVNGDNELRFTDDDNTGHILDEYGMWNIYTTGGSYSFTLNANSTNSHHYKLSVLNPDESLVQEFVLDGSSNTPLSATTDKINLVAGKYIIKIQNTTQYSKGRIISIVANYMGGATVDIPATLIPDDAILSDRAWVDKTGTVDSILFTPRGSEGYNLDEWVKWKVNVTKAGMYNFTANTYRKSSQKFEISLLNSDESATLISNDNGGSSIGSGNASISTGEIELATGIYIVKVRNIYQYAESRLLSVVVEYKGGATIDIPATLTPDDVILSDEAWVDRTGVVDSILFTARGSEGHNSINWAKWKVNVTKAGMYNFIANVCRPNGGQKYEIAILNNDESATLISNDNGGSSIGSGNASISSGNVDLAIGSYIVRVRNIYNYAESRLLSVVAEYAGGAVVNVPGELLGEDAMLCKEDGGTLKMYHLANGDIKYNDNGNNLTEYALWNIHADAACELEVALNIATAGHLFTVELYDGSTLLGSAVEADETKWDDGDIALADHLTIPAAGNYTIKLVNRQQYSGGALHGITFTEVIAPTFVTLDEMATDNIGWVENVGSAAVNVELSRSFTGGMYNTICLPFAVSSDKVIEAFGDGVELIYMTGATLDGSILDLEFASTTSIYPGTPYLIRPVSNVVNPQFMGVEFSLENASATAGENTDFIGTFIKSEVPAGENNLFLGQNNMLYFSQTATPIKGTRAYFRVNVPGGANLVKAARIVTSQNATTDINLVEQGVQTQKIMENGQLFIIKNGVKYNAMGQMVK
ncbi:MAG: hypothetical protein J5937_01350 [Paludibacteraceae bacterium]|nr:hypothetical protein [Paludibacteraceae bacterium]